jgi:hypothetical protein
MDTTADGEKSVTPENCPVDNEKHSAWTEVKYEGSISIITEQKIF